MNNTVNNSIQIDCKRSNRSKDAAMVNAMTVDVNKLN